MPTRARGSTPDPLSPEVTLDPLVDSWVVYQLRGGHRFNTDDMLLAWTAARVMPAAPEVLDLGAGIGSVGLMLLHRLGPQARLTSVEVQPVSADLLRRTVAKNGLARRVEVRCSDIRDPGALAGLARFPLIVANPPYLPPGKALRSPHPQRAAARLELHGDLFHFCQAAAAHLAPGGRFCFCHAAADPRPPRAIAAAGLTLLCRQDVVFRAGKPPTIALFTCGSAGRRQDQEPLVVRDASGLRTGRYKEIRAELELGG